jgi:toxin-antitoxin system PIN domain toxin
MKHLLDVNVLMAAVWTGHVHHSQAMRWVAGKNLVTCPTAELGFIRISTHKKALALPMASVRDALARFLKERKVEQISDDLPALESHPKTSDQVTDHYLADLATRHGFKLATMDQNLKHAAAELLSIEDETEDAPDGD